MNKRALLVEDDGAIATVIRTALADEGMQVDVCDTIVGRDELLARNAYDLMLTDVMLLDGDGIETLNAVHDHYPDLPVIILSAQNTLDTAVRATSRGAFEYFPKPFDLDELVRAAKQAAAFSASPGKAPEESHEGLPLIGRSQPMQEVFRLIARVLHNDLSVLVLGESGTGKELVAEAIHQLGNRKDGPFVAVNAAAIPRELIESELFGHERGAFTGATARSIGKFEQANGGTLFLDEIGDMPAEAQTRLLRALQSGTIRRIGGNDEIAVNVRIVAATNRDLAPMIVSGAFREDLFYRLNVVPIRLPALRDRAGDIEALAKHFLRRAASEGLPVRTLSDRAAKILSRQVWRGNVRELRNFMYRAALLSREDDIDAVTVAQLLDELPSDKNSDTSEEEMVDLSLAIARWLENADITAGTLYHSALAEFERPLFAHVLKSTGGNQVRAAQVLGINRNTLRKRLSELDLQPENFANH